MNNNTNETNTAVNTPAHENQEAQAGVVHLPNPDVITLTLEPRKWTVDAKRDNWKNQVERTFITDMTGGLTEAICLGNWSKNWTSVESPRMALKKNTDYVFTFWLNGGENDRNEELCQFRVYLDEDNDNPLIFRLNRDFIKPAKYHKGWYRYEIPFSTGMSEDYATAVVVFFQFAAMDAYCAVLPDKPEFADLPDEERPDPRIPQRHNIKYAGGYPRDRRWSHLVYGEQKQDWSKPQGNSDSQNRGNNFENLINAGVDIEGLFEHMESEDIADLLRGASLENLVSLGIDLEGLFEHMESEDVKDILRGMMNQ